MVVHFDSKYLVIHVLSGGPLVKQIPLRGSPPWMYEIKSNEVIWNLKGFLFKCVRFTGSYISLHSLE